jgi:SAM-dependent methyltransferase
MAMSKMSDQAYLLSDQYQDASNLDARIRLHARFSTNKYGWQRWAFDQFALSPQSRILELGGGNGALWRKNLDRIPEGWDITLSDLSPGMLEDARQNLCASQRRFQFEIVDAQSIPFESESFDAVIANHMLYHVPDRTKAFSEIRRILKPGGRCYASTVGRTHLQELDELVGRFAPDPELWAASRDLPFLLETGMAQVCAWFSEVTLCRYKDALVVTEADPLIAYVLSSTAKSFFVGDRLAAFTQWVERELALHGAIHITKDTGMFKAFRE